MDNLRSLAAGTAQAADVKIAHRMGPKHPMDRFIMWPRAKQVSEMSGGSLNVKVFPNRRLTLQRSLVR